VIERNALLSRALGKRLTPLTPAVHIDLIEYDLNALGLRAIGYEHFSDPFDNGIPLLLRTPT
jgi:hypothetical protein